MLSVHQVESRSNQYTKLKTFQKMVETNPIVKKQMEQNVSTENKLSAADTAEFLSTLNLSNKKFETIIYVCHSPACV